MPMRCSPKTFFLAAVVFIGTSAVFMSGKVKILYRPTKHIMALEKREILSQAAKIPHTGFSIVLIVAAFKRGDTPVFPFRRAGGLYSKADPVTSEPFLATLPQNCAGRADSISWNASHVHEHTLPVARLH